MLLLHVACCLWFSLLTVDCLFYLISSVCVDLVCLWLYLLVCSVVDYLVVCF